MFGKNIKKIRNVKGLSQQAFAELFDLKRGTLGAYEEGRSNPKLETIVKIAGYFKIGVDELLSSELTVNRLLHFNDRITTNTSDLKTEEFAKIPCITETQQIGYIQQHAKQSFVDKLPMLQLPLHPGTEYLAYTVPNLEMSWQGRGFFPKDIVVCKKLETHNYAKITQGLLVLVLTPQQLIFRRLYIHDNHLLLQADHENIEPIKLAKEDVLQLWEVVHVFHYRIPIKNDLMEDRLAILEKEILSLKKR